MERSHPANSHSADYAGRQAAHSARGPRGAPSGELFIDCGDEPLKLGGRGNAYFGRELLTDISLNGLLW